MRDSSKKDSWLITPVWPRESGRTLLHVALAPLAEVPAKWELCRPTLLLEEMNIGEQRLLPMVHARLTEAGVEDAWLPRFRGVYRNAWVVNQRVFQVLPTAVGILRDAGIPCLVAKGAALAHIAYAEPTFRPMEDFDLLIPENQIYPALDAFQAAGWNPRHGKRPLPRHLHLTHSVDLDPGSGVHLDLHWHLLAWALYPGADQHWWEGRESFELRGQTYETLAWTDHLLQCLVHGMHRNPVATLRWVLDAAHLLRRPERLDWERFLRLTFQLRQGLLVRETLAYLDREFQLPVPAEVSAALAQPRYTRRDHERFAFWTTELPRKDPVRFFVESYAMRQRWIPWWDVRGRVKVTLGQLEMHGGVEGAVPAITTWIRWFPRAWWKHSRLRDRLKRKGKAWRETRKAWAKTLRRKRQNLARKIAKRLPGKPV